MPVEITMPRLSDTMQQGTVVKWNVKEGQKIASGDVIADIETDKATMELQSFDDGTVASLAAAEGQTVPVGTVIAVLAAAGEDVAKVKAGAGSAAAASSGAKSTSSAVAKAASSGETGATTPTAAAVMDREQDRAAQAARGGEHDQNGHAPQPPNDNGGRIFASPLARKVAAERGVDLSAVEGSGPSGRIIRKDVEAVAGTRTSPAQRPAGAPGPRPQPMVPAPGAALKGRMVALSNMRRTIARRLVESKTTIPHYQVTVEVDMDALLTLRGQLNDQLADQGVKLSVNDFLVRACALAMHQHPFVNSRWVAQAGNESVEILGDVNIGVAISVPEEKGGGLVVATIRAADQIGLRQISAQTKQLAERARTKGLSIEEMSDSTFTISNLGMFGVDHFTAIINPPNVAILAVGAAIEKPVVRSGQVVVGHVMSMTMSSDHRVVDGAMAAQYLATVKSLLEKPATLLV
jgi:pyruvate dehydrogenase E2 component (dihydrolipoamide acetyltransferase)